MPLSREQIESVLPALSKMTELLTRKSPLSQDSVYWDFAGKIERAAHLLGIEKDAYAKAALKQPPLFCQSPKTIFRNFRYVQNAQRMGHIKTRDVTDTALSFPASFCYATGNTHLRAVHAQIGNIEFSLRGFFTGESRDKKSVEDAVIAHYTDIFNRTGKGVRTMQVLHEAGIISALPDWAPAPEKPLRQPRRPPEPS